MTVGYGYFTALMGVLHFCKVVTPCSSLRGYQHFGRKQCVHFLLAFAILSLKDSGSKWQHGALTQKNHKLNWTTCDVKSTIIFKVISNYY
jgi:hypothetical protein